ncbi:MAG: hypothetical protein D6726_12965, partial [Nitrospirae bacterium]
INPHLRRGRDGGVWDLDPVPRGRGTESGGVYINILLYKYEKIVKKWLKRVNDNFDAVFKWLLLICYLRK